MEPVVHLERLLLLRAGLPELWLRPGAMLSARVTERTGRHGLLMLAGTPLVAELPDGVEAGQRLRLRVTDATDERVTLQIVAEQPPPTAGALAVAVPLPGAGHAHVRATGDDEPGGRPDPDDPVGASVALVYESPALGALDLRLTLHADGIHAAVTAAPGEPLDAVAQASRDLREALQEATGRPAVVVVRPRRDPVDVYA